MSKLNCKCGLVISNSALPCPNEGSILGDCSVDSMHSYLIRKITEFLCISNARQRAEWLGAHFDDPLPVETADAEIIADLMIKTLPKFSDCVLECVSCRRLWVSDPDSLRFLSYEPEDAGEMTVLNRLYKSG